MMRKQITKAKRVVIKVGTSSIAHSNGKLNFKKIRELAEVLTDLANSGKEIILVSSGAIGAGIGRMNLEKRPEELSMKQAVAAIGQAYLIQIYQKYFTEFNRVCAQILLTKDIVDDQMKKENVIRTFDSLLELGVIPIVNENDSVATDEIIGSNFSDNDNLSGIVAAVTGADLLIIISDIEGLRKSVAGGLTDEIISTVEKIDDDIKKHVLTTKSELGTGGMDSKLKAANYLIKKGIDLVICSGADVKILYDILEGKEVGTIFKGAK